MIRWRDRSWLNRFLVVAAFVTTIWVVVASHSYVGHHSSHLAVTTSVDVLWLAVFALSQEMFNSSAVERLQRLSNPSNTRAMVKERSE